MARVDQLLRDSAFVFVGTVERLSAATLSVAPVSGRTAIVRVEEILRAPDSLLDHAGREITVELKDARIKPRQSAIFFTNGWLYGESLAVVEVGRQPISRANEERLITQTTDAIAALPRDELRRRIDAADLVVVGRVSALRAAQAPSALPGGEHDPRWWEAVVDVEAVEKGTAELTTVSVFFPTSLDVAWFHVPKPQPGQEGIWILSSQPVAELEGREVYTALHPLDVQPKDLGAWQHVRTLVKEVT